MSTDVKPELLVDLNKLPPVVKITFADRTRIEILCPRHLGKHAYTSGESVIVGHYFADRIEPAEAHDRCADCDRDGHYRLPTAEEFSRPKTQFFAGIQTTDGRRLLE